MATASAKANDKAQIRARLDEWVRASRVKDLDAIMANYAPDVLAFDAVGKLQFKGVDAYRKHWDACLSYCPGEMVFEIHDLKITARDDLAFGHYLGRCGGTGPDGKEHASWFRVTVCLRKMNGKWLVVHEHFSAPFDPESGNTLLDLQPESMEQASAA